MKSFTRTSPSPRYQRLLALYREMHSDGEVHLGIPPDQTFPGKSLPPQAGHIKRLIAATGAKTVLDYGCGKGNQYLPLPWKDEGGTVHVGIAAWWGVEVHCYDPAYPKFAELPTGEFDGVISTDVLEHCPEEDMPWIVGELFGYRNALRVRQRRLLSRTQAFAERPERALHDPPAEVVAAAGGAGCARPSGRAL